MTDNEKLSLLDEAGFDADIPDDDVDSEPAGKSTQAETILKLAN